MNHDHSALLHGDHCCRPLHATYLVATVLAGAALTFRLPVMLLFAIPFAAIAVTVLQLARRAERSRSTVAQGGPAKPLGIAARRVWRGTAVGLDALLILCAVATGIALMGDNIDRLVPGGSGLNYLWLALATTVIAVHALAHRMADRPAVTTSSEAA
ncbi:hypothetical protein ACFXKW_26480 [Streptomyces sp. NPDC059193]|uniref:hypothetical protein n=1 Tax=Streptomyces sp. NPDC059193 TaxID=3346763 RepID=UPI0036B6DBA3